MRTLSSSDGERRLAHLVVPEQRLQHQHVAAHAQRAEPGLLAQGEVHDRGAVGLLEGAPQQHVRLGRLGVGLEEVAAVEHDRVDLVARHELDDLDLAVALLGQRLQVVLREHDRALAVVVRLVDVLVVDDLAADLAAALVPDPPAVLVVHLVQRDVVVLGRAVDLHRHVDEAEGDRRPSRSIA